jgi:spore photoproduct lyase
MVTKINRKSLLIRPSGRSTDYISPSFGWGCLFDCSYCYMKRHKPNGLDIAKNTNDILTAIDHHAWFADVEKPNQTHSEYVTYDISCNEDFALHAKYHEWQKIFDFFKNHPRTMGSFATKYVNEKLLDYNPEKKIRIRFSLMPEDYRILLEPNTSRIVDRLDAVSKFLDAGYEVHLNFSPVIFHENWLKQYDLLFQTVEYWSRLRNWNKENVKAEVIFLTHNEKKHWYNLLHDLPGENLLWKPEIQESKKSQYGGENVRYKHDLKAEFIREWTQLHDQIIPWNTIRYIF